MRCYTHGQTSKDFNKIQKGTVKSENLKFGLSVLHARIRFFESLLHIAYKEPLKKWQARTPEEKKYCKRDQGENPKELQRRNGPPC